MGDAAGSRSPRPLFLAIAVVLAGSAVVAVATATAHRASRAAPPPKPAAPAAPRATPTRDPSAARVAAIDALLARRAAAVLHHDAAGFLGTVGGDPAFRTVQARLFANLAAVPFGSFRYDVDAEPATGSPSPTGGGVVRYAPSAVYLRFTLAGFDAEPTTQVQHPTFEERAGRWLVAADTTPGAPRTTPELWDEGPVVVVRGRYTLALGHPASRVLIAQAAAEADRDVPRVDAVWGTAWSRRVVVVVPASTRELGALLGGRTALGQIVAVATAELTSTSGRPDPVGDRVLLNPPAYLGLGAVGRQVVMTHEITHVATRPVTAAAAPTWLVEGFADYVGYRDSGVSTGVAARELAADVRAGRIPSALPPNAQFGGTNPRLAQVYEQAWLACRLIATRLGEATLVRFYRAAAVAGGSAQLAAAFARVLHSTPATFTSAWRRYLVQVLG